MFRAYWNEAAPFQCLAAFAASAQRALEGFSRSLAKELRNGSTLQLLYVAEGAEDQLEGALRFFRHPKARSSVAKCCA